MKFSTNLWYRPYLLFSVEEPNMRKLLFAAAIAVAAAVDLQARRLFAANKLDILAVRSFGAL